MALLVQSAAILFLLIWADVGYHVFKNTAYAKPTMLCYLNSAGISFGITVLIMLLLSVLFVLVTAAVGGFA